MRSYDTPLPPGHAGFWAAWTLDSPVTAALVLLAVAYAWAVRRRCERWPARRSWSFGVGLATALLVVDAWPGVYGRALLSVLTIRVSVLLLVSPVLLLFGRPGELFQLRVPRWTVLLANPFVAPLLIPVVLGVLFFTPVFGAVVDHRAVASFVELALLALGLLVAAPLVADESLASSLAVGLALAVGLVELLVDAVPGIAMRLSTHVSTPVVHLAARRTWGPAALHDQQLAGAILWGTAEILDLPYLVFLVRRMIRADAREASAVDAALDRDDREAARRPVSVADAPGAETDVQLDPPWWEKDASVFGDRRAQVFQRDKKG